MSTSAPGPDGSRRPPNHRSSEPDREESFLVRFAREYGWRAYAIPVLLVITIWVFIDIFTSSAAEPETVSGAGSSTQSTVETADPGASPDPAEMDGGDLPVTALPPGGDFAETGDGTYRVVGTPGAAAGAGEEKTMRYVVEVEDGVDTSAYGGDAAVSQLVDATLTDPRGWSNDPRFSFEHVAPDQNPNMHIQLTSAETTKEMCGVTMELETSCRTTLNGGNTIVLNDARWNRGAESFEGDLGSYRQYLINHEVGHGLGYSQHVACGEDGALAPIMMQQTLGLSNSELNEISPEEIYPDDGATCQYNPWPYPQSGSVPDNPGHRMN